MGVYRQSPMADVIGILPWRSNRSVIAVAISDGEIGASSAGRPRGWSERSAADEGAVRRPGARLQPFDQVGERYGAEAMITDLMAIRRKDISARHFLGKSPRHVRVLAKLTQWKKG
jgi:hypothetical protein